MQHITVVPYDPAWPGLYEAEAQAIAGVLGQRLTAIHHIGSTAVPGLAANPVIDIMPVVRAVTEADECRADFEALGYEYLGEFGIPGRRYLRAHAPALQQSALRRAVYLFQKARPLDASRNARLAYHVHADAHDHPPLPLVSLPHCALVSVYPIRVQKGSGGM